MGAKLSAYDIRYSKKKRSGRRNIPLSSIDEEWFIRKDFESLEIYERSFPKIKNKQNFSYSGMGVPERYDRLLYCMIWRIQDVLNFHKSEKWASEFKITILKSKSFWDSKLNKQFSYLYIKTTPHSNKAIKSIIKKYSKLSVNYNDNKKVRVIW